MPTENRSSTIEQHDHIEGVIDMVSVPRVPTDEMIVAFAEAWYSKRQAIDDPDMLDAYAAMIAAAPAPKPHPDPIAWMVGTAFWWTKEEAERDAAASGLSMIPFGPLTGSAEVEQLREVIKHSDAQIMRQSMRISNQRAQLAKQEALLRELIQIAEDREQGYSDRLHGGVVNGKAADSLVMLMGRMKLAVSSDAGPSAAAERQP